MPNSPIRSTLLLSAAITLLAVADTSVADDQLLVSGTSLPRPCGTSFTNGGVVDFGVFPAASLPRNDYLRPQPINITMRITCDARVVVAIGTTDEQPASLLRGVSSLFPQPRAEDQLFGLGLVRGKVVGALGVEMRPAGSLVDDRPAQILYRHPGQSVWTATPDGYMATNGAIHTWTVSGGLIPTAHRTFSARMGVFIVLQKPELLPLTQEVPIRGRITFEVIHP